MLFDFLRRTPKPFATGYLPEQDGHHVFFQQFGNPNGIPVLCFHGGPGNFSMPKDTKKFDLKKQHVILFDQRGCGQSLPAGELQHNTASDLIADAKRLLDHLKLQKAVILGDSWGSMLALLFAQQYTDCVSKLILARVFLGRMRDIDWLTNETRRFYPDIMAQLEQHVPDGKALRAHYADLMLSDDEAAQNLSARMYGHYDLQLGKLSPVLPDTDTTPEHMKTYRTYIHYDRQNFCMGNNQILEQAHLLAHIPTLIVHNRLDLLCPPEQPWLLHKALPKSKLMIVPALGHGGPLLKRILKREIAEFLN